MGPHYVGIREELKWTAKRSAYLQHVAVNRDKPATRRARRVNKTLEMLALRNASINIYNRVRANKVYYV